MWNGFDFENMRNMIVVREHYYNFFHFHLTFLLKFAIIEVISWQVQLRNKFMDISQVIKRGLC